MKIYLDDERQTPPGFIRTYTVEETIQLLIENEGKIDILSLDNDLGDGFLEGYRVMDWIEEKVFTENYKPPTTMLVHSANPQGRKRMLTIIDRINNFIENQ